MIDIEVRCTQRTEATFLAVISGIISARMPDERTSHRAFFRFLALLFAASAM